MYKRVKQAFGLMVSALIIVGLYHMNFLQSYDFWKQVLLVSLLVGVVILITGGYGDDKKEAVNE